MQIPKVSQSFSVGISQTILGYINHVCTFDVTNYVYLSLLLRWDLIFFPYFSENCINLPNAAIKMQILSAICKTDHTLPQLFCINVLFGFCTTVLKSTTTACIDEHNKSIFIWFFFFFFHIMFSLTSFCSLSFIYTYHSWLICHRPLFTLFTSCYVL